MFTWYGLDPLKHIICSPVCCGSIIRHIIFTFELFFFVIIVTSFDLMHPVDGHVFRTTGFSYSLMHTWLICDAHSFYLCKHFIELFIFACLNLFPVCVTFCSILCNCLLSLFHPIVNFYSHPLLFSLVFFLFGFCCCNIVCLYNYCILWMYPVLNYRSNLLHCNCF